MEKEDSTIFVLLLDKKAVTTTTSSDAFCVRESDEKKENDRR